ncbi:hypothetical protein RFI_37122 [Reticulomyxa filosa]|uniref:Uncharacterized protein n=1 Tax=Reticulomyxa filosa TaxID=46433 RepID=X6LG35_RETFI|nr:hypothetical protein RFI_37122 [Reticulomyxa filosa]|eukprot:ETO00326.1 hypothetical protein RFI_37122 [Reticulomyxa filosa]
MQFHLFFDYSFRSFETFIFFVLFFSFKTSFLMKRVSMICEKYNNYYDYYVLLSISFRKIFAYLLKQMKVISNQRSQKDIVSFLFLFCHHCSYFATSGDDMKNVNKYLKAVDFVNRESQTPIDDNNVFMVSSLYVGFDHEVNLTATITMVARYDDLHRTFPCLSHFQKEGLLQHRLRELLQEYAFYQPDIGNSVHVLCCCQFIVVLDGYAAFKAKSKEKEI